LFTVFPSRVRRLVANFYERSGWATESVCVEEPEKRERGSSKGQRRGSVHGTAFRGLAITAELLPFRKPLLAERLENFPTFY
jgi:hypothetical protein